MMDRSRQKPALWFGLSLVLHSLFLVTYGCWPERDATESPKSSIRKTESFTLQAQLIALPHPDPAPQANTPKPAVLTGEGHRIAPKPPETSTLPPNPQPQKEKRTSVSKPEEHPETEGIEAIEPPLRQPAEKPTPVSDLEKTDLVTERALEPTHWKPANPPQAQEPPPIKTETMPSQALAAETTITENESSLGTFKGASAELIRGPLPPYPRSARSAGIEGVTTILRVEIDPRGKATSVTVTRSCGHAALDRSALNTVKRKWRFKAARAANNEPIKSSQEIAIEWQLN